MSTALVLKNNKIPDHVKASKGNGLGNEQVGVEHLAIPRLKLLQKMSDEVDRHHDNYVAGAADGDFINSLDKALYGSSVVVVNLRFTDDFVVWKKREKGGGFLGNFDTQAEAQKAIDEQEDPEHYDVTQTHSHLLLMLDEVTGEMSKPILMDMSSSKLRVSRTWNSQISMKGGDRFSGVWKLSSKQTQNRAGNSFMNMDVTWLGWATDEIYEAAKATYEAFA